MKDSQKQILQAFLDKNNCSKEFWANTRKDADYTSEENLPCRIEWLISANFEWISAPEGYWYWADMNDKWLDHIGLPYNDFLESISNVKQH